LILSTKGSRSEADKMSGGDYDGDFAWVCWNAELVSQVSGAEPVNTTGPDFQLKPSDDECQRADSTTVLDKLKYARHFKKHQSHLGIMANLLNSVMDKFGANSTVALKVGTKAFLQVDHPYRRCVLDEETRGIVDRIGSPHWTEKASGSSGTYKSSKALGELWTYVEDKIQAVLGVGARQTVLNPHILQLIRDPKKVSFGPAYVEKLRAQMYQAAQIYEQKMLSFCRELNASIIPEDERKRKFHLWKHDYCQEQYQKLIRQYDRQDRQEFAAALLYYEAYKFQQTKRKKSGKIEVCRL